MQILWFKRDDADTSTNETDSLADVTTDLSNLSMTVICTVPVLFGDHYQLKCITAPLCYTIHIKEIIIVMNIDTVL